MGGRALSIHISTIDLITLDGGGQMYFIQGVVLASTFSWVAGTFVGPLGFMDVPVGRRQHPCPTPRTGGLALALTLFSGLGMGYLALPFSTLQVLGLIGLGLLGCLDDQLNLRARWKALGGLALALVVALPVAQTLSAQAGTLTLLGFELANHGWVYFALVTLATWSLPQSFNLIDGANGLAIGYGGIILLVLAWHGFAHPFLLGSLLGLLAFNWPRARHFLGDCGSLGLGLMLVLLAIDAFGGDNPNAILWLFAYPILDVTMVVAIRLANRRALGIGDRNHFHFQWQDRFPALGRAVVPLLWLQAGACALGAVATGWVRVLPWLGLSSLLVQAMVYLILALRDQNRAPAAMPLEIR